MKIRYGHPHNYQPHIGPLVMVPHFSFLINTVHRYRTNVSRPLPVTKRKINGSITRGQRGEPYWSTRRITSWYYYALGSHDWIRILCVYRDPISTDVDAPAPWMSVRRGNMGQGGAWGTPDHTDQCEASILCFCVTNLHSPWNKPALVPNNV